MIREEEFPEPLRELLQREIGTRDQPRHCLQEQLGHVKVSFRHDHDPFCRDQTKKLDEEVDCLGVCGGNASLDSCGICGGDNSTCSGEAVTGGCDLPNNTIHYDFNTDEVWYKVDFD